MSANIRTLQLLTRSARASSPSVYRSFSISATRMAEGDTGAPRSGGSAQGDAFTKREQASEDFYVRQQEKAKLDALKKRIADNEAQLAKDRKEAEHLTKKSQ